MPVFETGQCYEVIVRSVDKDQMVCEVSPAANDELTITARLTSAIDNTPESYFQVFPKENSTVLVQAIKDDPDDVVVHTVREVDEVRFKIGETTFKSTADGHVFDGGGNGGMIVHSKFLEEYNKTKAVVDAISDTLQNWVVAPTDGGAALKTAFALAISGKSTGSMDEITNNKVKH
jgi:hypothetical protein